MAETVKPRKTVLVTGGARRIGRAICEGLADAGFAVAIHANNSLDEAEALADSLRDRGGRAVALSADLRDPAAAAGLVRQADDVLGGLGVVVNNASVFEADTLKKLDMEIWNTHFDLHVRAPSIILGEFARLMPAGAQGLAVNIIDQRVWAPTPGFYSYTLSKSALWTATRTMAMSLAPQIRVNAIGPGPSLPNDRQNVEDFRAQVDAVLLKRGPELDEFARTVLYFYDTPSVTGQMIALDGGQHLAWETPDVSGMAE